MKIAPSFFVFSAVLALALEASTSSESMRGRGGGRKAGYDGYDYVYNHQYPGHGYDYMYNHYYPGVNPSTFSTNSFPSTLTSLNPSTLASFNPSTFSTNSFPSTASYSTSYCKSVAEFLHLSDTSVCVASATTATSGSSPTNGEEDGLTFSTEIFLCPKQKLFIQTCANSKSLLNIDVPILVGDPIGAADTTVTSTATADVTVNLDSIEITDCDGDWEEGFEPDDEFVMMQRNGRLSHAQEFEASVSPTDVNSLLSLDKEYTDNSCVDHMYEADDHFYGKCTLKWQFSAVCTATATESINPTTQLLPDLKDPAARAELKSLVATAVILGNVPSYSSLYY